MAITSNSKGYWSTSMRIQYNGYHSIGNAYLKHKIPMYNVKASVWRRGVRMTMDCGLYADSINPERYYMQGAWELSFHVTAATDHVGRSTTHAVSVHSCQINSLSMYIYYTPPIISVYSMQRKEMCY